MNTHDHEPTEVVDLLPIDDQAAFPYEYAFMVGEVIVIRTIFGDVRILRDA